MEFPTPTKYSATLEKKEQVTQNTLLLRFALTAPLYFIPGQFVIIYFTQQNGMKVKRSYSIASDNAEDMHVELCVTIKEKGIASTTFMEAKIGASFEIEGPYGRFCVQNDDDTIILVAAGSGIAPFRSMLYDLARKQKKVTLIYGFRTENDYLYKNELEKLHSERIKIIPTASQPKNGWVGDVGRVTVTVKKHLKPDHQKVFICGATPMVIDTINALEEIGFSREQIKCEGWG